MTHTYSARTFTIPEVAGLSQSGVDAHIGLYNGYVSNFNAMTTLLQELAQDSEKNAHALSEIVRRRSFEFGGMRLHEHYFSQLESGAQALASDSPLTGALAAQFGSVEGMLTHLKAVGMMRGPGWALLYYDADAQQFHIGFTGEQHQGHFVTLPIILALDVWEHAYMPDYGTTGKGGYIDAYLAGVNWEVVAKRFVALL